MAPPLRRLPLSPEEAARRAALGLDWIRIQAAMQRSRDVRALVREYVLEYGEDVTNMQAEHVRQQLIEVLEEMNSARGR